jgi:hypothetical protein
MKIFISFFSLSLFRFFVKGWTNTRCWLFLLHHHSCFTFRSYFWSQIYYSIVGTILILFQLEQTANTFDSLLSFMLLFSHVIKNYNGDWYYCFSLLLGMLISIHSPLNFTFFHMLVAINFHCWCPLVRTHANLYMSPFSMGKGLLWFFIDATSYKLMGVFLLTIMWIEVCFSSVVFWVFGSFFWI